MRVIFSILHYMTYDDTHECIQSLLLNIKYDNYEIVVVDNGSKNQSYAKLKENFSNNERVHLLRNDSNLGFAKGNNVGYMYAKEELKADFIILLNNDIIFEQNEFINIMLEIHAIHKFNILGPDILSTIDSQHQNPQRTKGFEVSEIKNIILRLTLKLWLNKIKLENTYLAIKKIYKKYCKGKENENGYDSNLHWDKEMTNVQLHGACLIFDPQYVKKYNGLYSNTFMYAEEDVMQYIAQKEKLKVLYSPKLQIFHKEASATNQVFSKSEAKRKFIYYHSRNSLREILKMENNNQIYKNDIISRR